jgi:hypothetical protein
MLPKKPGIYSGISGVRNLGSPTFLKIVQHTQPPPKAPTIDPEVVVVKCVR